MASIDWKQCINKFYCQFYYVHNSHCNEVLQTSTAIYESSNYNFEFEMTIGYNQLLPYTLPILDIFEIKCNIFYSIFLYHISYQCCYLLSISILSSYQYCYHITSYVCLIIIWSIIQFEYSALLNERQLNWN